MTITQELERLAHQAHMQASHLLLNGDAKGAEMFVKLTSELRALAEKYRGCVAVEPTITQDKQAPSQWYAAVERQSEFGFGRGEALANLQRHLDEQRQPPTP